MTRKERRKLRDKAASTAARVEDRNFSMKRIQPMTQAQSDFFDSYDNDKNIAAIGSAGTGKSYVALYLALKDVLENEDYDSVTVIRSAVQTRDQGFMPGTLAEKEAYFEAPYIDIVNDLFERGDAYGVLKMKKQIKFMSTSFVRGLSLDNTVIIVDECQNMTEQELDSVMTRVGKNSRIIFCGDMKQSDLYRKRNDVSGLSSFISVIELMSRVDVVKFHPADIVRSGLVKEYLLAKERLEDGNLRNASWMKEPEVA